MAEYLVQSGKDIDSVTEYLKYGDRVIVEDGDFDSVDVKVSGITYEALNPRKAITGQWVWSRDVNSVKIDGFEAVHSNYNAFELNKNNKDNWITNCGIHTKGTCGVDIANNGDDNKVEGCDIHDMHYAFHTSNTANYRNIFFGNHCWNFTGDIINVSPASYGTKILYNIMHDAEDDGIHLFDDGKPEAIGNLIYRCKGVPFWINGREGSIGKNNTIIGVAPKDWKNIVVWLEKSGHIFRNNIVYTTNPDMKLLVGSGDIDYNYWEDPKFVDITNNDYRLQSNSPCINAGDDGKNMGYWQGAVTPEPEPEPQPEYIEKSVLIEALQGMIDKIKE